MTGHGQIPLQAAGSRTSRRCESPPTSSNTFQHISITDSNAHLGNSYVSHNHYYEEANLLYILTCLSELTYKDVHRAIQDRRLAGTGSSILKSADYLQWRDGSLQDSRQTHSLWCYGSLGIGKTFLASSIIDDIPTGVDGQHAIVCMYSRRDRTFEQTVSSCLGSFARQLVEMMPTSTRHKYLDCLKKFTDSARARTPQRLLDLLATLSTGFERIYIVFDALDEFSDELDDQSHLIRAFNSFQSALQVGRVRICITSRRSTASEWLFSPRWLMKLESSPMDLDAYVRSRIGRSVRLSQLCSLSLQEKVVEQVLSRCGGV